MILCAKARALINGRFAVTMEDLKSIAYPVLRHRLIVNFKAEAEGLVSDQVTKELLQQVKGPKVKL